MRNGGLATDPSRFDPEAIARRQEIVSGRTQMLLARLGLVWPPIAAAGQMEMLHQAAELFSQTTGLKSTAACASSY
ncbi:MAG: hypothetical protein ABSF46_22225 [Terriglobia bacterium]